LLAGKHEHSKTGGLGWRGATGLMLITTAGTGTSVDFHPCTTLSFKVRCTCGEYEEL